MAQFQTFYYEQGSAAHQLETRTFRTREEYLREQQERQEERRRARIRAHRAAKRANRRFTVMFALGLGLCGCFFVTYVHLQNKITTSLNHISTLESRISELKTENAAAKNRISTSANLGHIKDIAVGELGMVYAGSDQIVYYTIDEADYMSQYEAVE